MNQTNTLKPTNFGYLLKLYELSAHFIKAELLSLETKTTLTPDEINSLAFYTQAQDRLIESTFLQWYSELEAWLYWSCKNQVIKKNACISRFEKALIEEGFNLDNEAWQALVHSSKIRNCLLHGNGRLDNDRYGLDTRKTIEALNSNTLLIETIPLEDGAKIKIKEPLLEYYIMKTKQFLSMPEFY